MNYKLPTTVICRLSSVNCPRTSTSVENPLQIDLFMQNKPNLVRRRRIANSVCTTDYENKSNWTLGENKPNLVRRRRIANPMSKQLVWSKPRWPESAKMARKIDVLKHQNIILKNSNFLYPNRLSYLTQHNPPTGTSFAHLISEKMNLLRKEYNYG